jgi:hypothetical protein
MSSRISYYNIANTAPNREMIRRELSAAFALSAAAGTTFSQDPRVAALAAVTRVYLCPLTVGFETRYVVGTPESMSRPGTPFQTPAGVFHDVVVSPGSMSPGSSTVTVAILKKAHRDYQELSRSHPNIKWI